MAVIPLRPTDKAPEPVINADLVAELERLLESAKKGEVQGFLGAYIVNGVDTNYYMNDEGWLPLLYYAANVAIRELLDSPEDE